MTTQEKFQALLSEMKGRFFERETDLQRLFVTAIAGGNILFLGPPGTAKSAMVETFAKHLSVPYFGIQLFRTSSPEEVWGPLDMIKFKAGVQARVTSGSLAEATIGFVDEIWKGNSAINNSLLRAAEVNNRKFKNGTEGWIDLPLKMLVGASNEMPDGGAKGELAAIYDRFEMRRVVKYLHDDKSFEGMLRLNGNKVGTTLTEAEYQEAVTESQKVSVSDTMYKTLVGVWKMTNAEGLSISDRKFRNTIRYLKASAWLDGRTEVTDDDIEVLCDLLWETPEQLKQIRKIVLQFANPINTQANDIYDRCVEAFSGVKQLSKVEQSRAAQELNAKLKEAVKTCGNLSQAAKAEGKSSAIADMRLQQLKDLNETLVKDILLAG